MIPPLAQLKLYAQEALLGRVTPSLRAMYVNLEEEIEIVLYYNHALTEKEKKLSATIVEEIKNHYQEQPFSSSVDILSYPKKMPLKGGWVFYRYEDSSQYED